MTVRLDRALVERGLAPSRSRAALLVAEGLVRVDGSPARKAATPVGPETALDVEGQPGYVSRAALKLLAALDAFDIRPAGRLALDVGASTGGFTQVLLERGASRVIALDVGHGQLAAELRDDPRVTVVEGFNARELSPAALATASGVTAAPALAVADVSFIRLGLVLPGIRAVVAPEADIVALVKPQFEVGRGGVRAGIVREPSLRAAAVRAVLEDAWALGLGTAGIRSSPIAGGHGNREALVHLSARVGTHPTEWEARIAEATA
ncbi:MAG: TlyA family RNA methyltransferase [Microbacteriaceae bacterium]